MKLVFLGSPGVGKGSYAKIVGKELNIPHISTGDMLREEVKKSTPLGLKAKDFMDSGDLVPDELIIELAEKRLQEDDCKNGYILDGFPRDIEQARELSKVTEIDKVIHYFANEDTIIDRLSGRRTCEDCKSIFHITNNPPKVEDVCDNCGGKLFQRKDATPKVIHERLLVYEKTTKPLIKYYEDKDVLIHIESESTPELIAKETIEKLK